MAATPNYAAAPVITSGVINATADTSYTAPSHTVTVAAAQGPRIVTDGVLNSTTLLTSATAAFNVGDISRPVSASGIPAGTTIVAVASATNVTLSAPATASTSGVTVTLGGGQGCIVPEITVTGIGTTVAGVINLFVLNGGVYSLYDSFVVTVVTPSTTTAPFRAVHDYGNLWLPPTASLVASSWAASQLAAVSCAQLNS